jgi:phage shock protein A
MADNIASRVSRLISGAANQIVDAAENLAPEAVMEQAIREVDHAVDDVRAELGRAVARKHLASQRLAEENRKHDELSEKARLAAEQGRDDLAEAAIGRLLDIETQIPLLEQAIAGAGEEEAELEGFVAALRARKREMQDELAQVRKARKAAGESTEAGGGPGGRSVEDRVSKAESAFERVMERTVGVGGSGKAPDAKTAKQLAELDDMARKKRIAERLRQIKGQG